VGDLENRGVVARATKTTSVRAALDQFQLISAGQAAVRNQDLRSNPPATSSPLVFEHMHTGIPIANEHQALLGHKQVSGLRVKRDVGAWID